ncbi:MAG: PAS domain-containing protein, partial [Halohasta sp.]
MRQIRVLYLHPASEPAEPVVAAVEAAAPELSVSHTSSPSQARALLDTDSVDCLVVDRLSTDETSSIVETARSSAPTVPVLRFTDEPPDRVVDRFDAHTDYLYKQEPTEQAALLAHRIRTLVAADSPSAAAAESDAIVDSSYAGILVFDAEGRITLLNPAAERMLGFPAADAIGNTCETLDMRTDRDEPLAQHDRPVVRVLDTGEPVVDELVSVPADEGRRWLSISASPLANGETVGGVVVTLDDVSAEVELEITLEPVLDRMTDGFAAFDTDLRFTYLSE